MIERTRRAAPVLGSALALLLPLASPAAAQSSDFLFGRPSVTLALRGGWAWPTARSDIFDEIRLRLGHLGDPNDPIDRGDFAGFAAQADLGIRLSDRLDLTLGVAHSEAEIHSEDRDFVGEDDLPVAQTTTFRRTPIEIGLKGYLWERGRSVSRFAWVPRAWAPYLAAGAGVMVYDFEQSGEFVDYQSLDIFQATFQSEGTTPTAHVAAGVDVSLHKHVLLTTEARYQWARADMGSDFVGEPGQPGFDAMDLSGFQTTIGFAVRF